MSRAETPRSEYRRRLEDRRATHALLDRRERAISNGRLAAVGVAVLLLILVLATDWLGAGWIGLPVAVFLVLVVLHDRVIQARDRAAIAIAHWEQALHRLDHTWPGTGIQRADYVAEDHPYAADLDLFGSGSLFELLCTARTRSGEETLARWLAGPAAPGVVRERQQAVDELRPLLDLREDLALQGGGLRSTIDPEALASWGSAPAVFAGSAQTLLRWTAAALALGAVAGVALWWADWLGPLPLATLVGVAVAEWVVYKLVAPRLKQVVSAVDRASRELKVLALVLARLERETFRSPLLARLQARLRATGDEREPAGRAIRRLDRLVVWLDAQRNMLFAPIAFLLMWPVHFALAIESWRLRAGRHIESWLEALGELEALCALAAYAYEHPDDPFPELVEQGPLFHGDDLGHPLIPEESCVSNSVQLDPQVRAWIVSGSNMSGKTTLMRTVGVNAVLAQAGAPVRARGLTLSPLAVGATIRVHDSLQAKRSRFYAEIHRLKQLMDLTGGERPLLFLLDEVLHGTNSRDRLVGATALLHQFIAAGAVGLVTTHDLAIADAAEGLAGQVANVHFEDQLVQGQLSFDYKVKPGVVQGSNAIELMRAVGLEVQPVEGGLKNTSSSSPGRT
jgi:hypothetical protein